MNKKKLSKSGKSGKGPVTVHGDPPAKDVTVPGPSTGDPPLKRRDVRAGNG